mgnify:CR=1 FL=1
MKLAEDTKSKLMILHTAAGRVGAMDVGAVVLRRECLGAGIGLAHRLRFNPVVARQRVRQCRFTDPGRPKKRHCPARLAPAGKCGPRLVALGVQRQHRSGSNFNWCRGCLYQHHWRTW